MKYRGAIRLLSVFVILAFWLLILAVFVDSSHASTVQTIRLGAPSSDNSWLENMTVLDNNFHVISANTDNSYTYITATYEATHDYTHILSAFGVGLFVGYLSWGFSRIFTMYGRFTK